MWPAPTPRFLRSRQLSPRSLLSRVLRSKALHASSATVCAGDHVIARAAGAGPASGSAPLAITSTLCMSVSITLSPHSWIPDTRARHLQRRTRDRSRCASGAGAAMGGLGAWPPCLLEITKTAYVASTHLPILAITSTLRTLASIACSLCVRAPCIVGHRLRRRARDRARSRRRTSAVSTLASDHVNSAHARFHRVFFASALSLHHHASMETQTTRRRPPPAAGRAARPPPRRSRQLRARAPGRLDLVAHGTPAARSAI